MGYLLPVHTVEWEMGLRPFSTSAADARLLRHHRCCKSGRVGGNIQSKGPVRKRGAHRYYYHTDLHTGSNQVIENLNLLISFL